MTTTHNYTVKLRSNSRDITLDIAELSTPQSYNDLIEANTAAEPYVTAHNLASDEPKDWYAVPTSSDSV
jgi:short-subunit dehydrogenase involved in D-alanine esterification of teichoic acids